MLPTKVVQSICFSILFTTCCVGQVIKTVEPPFWWAGMVNQELQLLIHGDQIGELNAKTSTSGIEILDTHKAESPDYLFVDIKISKDIIPQTVQIEFHESQRLVQTIEYELKQRKKGSANRIGFNSSDVLYLITPDRFANGNPSNDELANLKEGLNREGEYGRHGGDLQGIIQHLDYIESMGFSSIWLNPVLTNDQAESSYHGYSTTDYYHIDPRFGTNEEYVKMTRLAAEKGIGVIMDIIVNHCGSEHWWMADPPFKDWINHYEKDYRQTNHRKSTLVDPYASSSDRSLMTEGWFVPTMPDLNQRNPFMSTYLIQNSIWWIEYADLHGIRQDTYSYPFRDFMTDWTCAIQTEYPNFTIVGEEWVENPAIIAYWQEGKLNHDGYTSCLGSLMDFPLNATLNQALKEKEGWGSGLIRLYEMLGNDFLYADPAALVIFADNHDMSRIYTQLNEDYDLFKMAMSVLMTMRGTPQVYYGTELLMSHKGTTSHGAIRSDFPGGWDGDLKSGFTGEGLPSQALEAQQWLSQLIKWRNNVPVIHTGKLMHFVPQDGLYTYFRYDDNMAVMVILNKSTNSAEVDLSRFQELLKNYSKFKVQGSQNWKSIPAELIIQPLSATIIELGQ